MKFSPFQQVRRPEIVPIGTEETGIVYLLKRKALTPNENPVSRQELANNQRELSLIFFQAAKNLAETEGKSDEEAIALVFPQKNADGTVSDGLSIYKYLSPEQISRLIELQSVSADVPIKAATLLIRHRIAYPVILSERASAKETRLDVDPLWFPLQIGDRIKYDNLIVTVSDNADIGADSIKVESLPGNLDKKSVGFLLDFETGSEKIGTRKKGVPDALAPEERKEIIDVLTKSGMSVDQVRKTLDAINQALEDRAYGWSYNDTRNLLTEEQINAIHEFYQVEEGAIVADQVVEGKSQSSNPSKALPEASNNPVSTGERSTGDLPVVDVEMNDSQQNLLEISQSG